MIERILKSALICLICVACVPLHLQAQRNFFRHFTAADGLGSSSVNHIFQDSRGYVWLATQGGGVSRYNGKEFTTYTKKDGLVNNDVTYIAEDTKHNIWIATASGVSKFNGIYFTNYKAAQGLTDGVVYCIYPDNENNLWFATQDKGVIVFRNGKLDSVTVKQGLPSNEVYTITQSTNGVMWFGLNGGIVKYAQGEAEVISSGAGKTFFSSCKQDNRLWFGSVDGTLISVNENGVAETLPLPNLVNADFIGGITGDKQGNLWLALDHGLLKYDGSAFNLYGEKQGLSVNTAQTVMADYEGNVWCGTLNGGVNLLQNQAFVVYNENDGLRSLNITSICAAYNNSYYVSTYDGLYLFNREFEKLQLPKVLEGSSITHISTDVKNNWWLCANDAVHVVKANGKQLHLLKSYTHIAGEQVVSPLKAMHDNHGNTWIATYGSGVFKINGSTEYSYSTSNQLATNNILTVFQDNSGNVWFGTQDAGAIMYDGVKFTSPTITNSNEIEKPSVWNMAQARDGTMFLGTGESGLCVYRNGKVTYITSKDGLSADYIPALWWHEKEHTLWLAGEKGLDKVEFANNYTIKKIHRYTSETGITINAANHHGLMGDSIGNLWLCSVKGLWHYSKNLHSPKQAPAKIQLADVKLFYGREELSNYSPLLDTINNLPLNLVLPHNKNHLTFSMRALCTSPALFTFMLQGQDADWSLPAKNTEVTYSNLAPGTYTFKAKAVTNGTESSNAIAYTFTVAPPWWQTWWFYFIVVSAFVLGLYLYIKTRERLLRQQNIRLEETVKQRTSVIEQQKQTVEKMLSEKEILLREIHHRVKNNLQTISSMLMLQSAGLKDEEAKNAITESQSRVRSIALVHQKLYQTDGLEKVELNAFVNDLANQIQSLYRNAPRQINVQINIPETYILIDKAIPLGLILNELFTNSLKYAFPSDSGTISVHLVSEPQNVSPISKKVRLIYSDSGTGFDFNEQSKKSATLGVRLIKLLSQQMGAELSYTNSTGSSFELIFSINV